MLADVSAVLARGGQPVAVPMAQTAQGTTTFTWVASSPRMVAAQVAAACELGPLHAVKWGMVPGPAQLSAARAALQGTEAWWVVDPVVRTSRGQVLSRLSPKAYLALAGPRVVLTPNLDEAGWLLGEPAPRSVEEAAKVACALVRYGFGAVLVKGGHLPGDEGLVDVLATPGPMVSVKSRHLLGDEGPATRKWMVPEVRLLHGEWLERAPELRGTGCRLASALATELGQGHPLEAAVNAARELVARYLRAG